MEECGTRLIRNVKANERDHKIYKDAAMPDSDVDLFMIISPMIVF